MEIDKLQKGLIVTYIPMHARDKEWHPDREIGKITSWNDSFVFVDYGTGNSKATRLEDLQSGDQTFHCQDDNNSVLSGAFGRCESVCRNCNPKKYL